MKTFLNKPHKGRSSGEVADTPECSSRSSICQSTSDRCPTSGLSAFCPVNPARCQLSLKSLMSQHLPLFINNTLSCARETQCLLPDLCLLTPVQPQSSLFHRKGLPPPTAWNSFRLWSLSGFLSLRPLAGDGSRHPKISACSAVHRTRELFLVAGPWCPKSLQAGRPASHVTDSRAGAELC